jgi:hypothetical protein
VSVQQIYTSNPEPIIISHSSTLYVPTLQFFNKLHKVQVLPINSVDVLARLLAGGPESDAGQAQRFFSSALQPDED